MIDTSKYFILASALGLVAGVTVNSSLADTNIMNFVAKQIYKAMPENSVTHTYRVDYILPPLRTSKVKSAGGVTCTETKFDNPTTFSPTVADYQCILPNLIISSGSKGILTLQGESAKLLIQGLASEMVDTNHVVETDTLPVQDENLVIQFPYDVGSRILDKYPGTNIVHLPQSVFVKPIRLFSKSYDEKKHPIWMGSANKQNSQGSVIICDADSKPSLHFGELENAEKDGSIALQEGRCEISLNGSFQQN